MVSFSIRPRAATVISVLLLSSVSAETPPTVAEAEASTVQSAQKQPLLARRSLRSDEVDAEEQPTWKQRRDEAWEAAFDELNALWDEGLDQTWDEDLNDEWNEEWKRELKEEWRQELREEWKGDWNELWDEEWDDDWDEERKQRVEEEWKEALKEEWQRDWNDLWVEDWFEEWLEERKQEFKDTWREELKDVNELEELWDEEWDETTDTTSEEPSWQELGEEPEERDPPEDEESRRDFEPEEVSTLASGEVEGTEDDLHRSTIAGEDEINEEAADETGMGEAEYDSDPASRNSSPDIDSNSSSDNLISIPLEGVVAGAAVLLVASLFVAWKCLRNMRRTRPRGTEARSVSQPNKAAAQPSDAVVQAVPVVEGIPHQATNEEPPVVQGIPV